MAVISKIPGLVSSLLSQQVGLVECCPLLESRVVLGVPCGTGVCPLPLKFFPSLIPAKLNLTLTLAWTRPALAGTSCSRQICESSQEVLQYLPAACSEWGPPKLSNDPEARSSSSLIDDTFRTSDYDAFSSCSSFNSFCCCIPYLG